MDKTTSILGLLVFATVAYTAILYIAYKLLSKRVDLNAPKQKNSVIIVIMITVTTWGLLFLSTLLQIFGVLMQLMANSIATL